MAKRVFLIVLDSCGIGEAPDAQSFGDTGANTVKSISESKEFNIENLKSIGFTEIDGLSYLGKGELKSEVARLREKSKGKDTTIGHWEIAGIVSEKPLPTFPNGFPKELLDEFSRLTGRGVLCNKPYSGTEVIKDYGEEHLKTGALIVYTSADSVFQIAAHEKLVPPEKLYEYCRIAREILQGDHGVGRVIARPFEGEYPDFRRTANRHDFSLVPPGQTLLDLMSDNGLDVIPIGKIYDIFAGKSLRQSNPTKSNADGMKKTQEAAKEDFNGLCFVNLVDFDMVYGHRNNAEGYAKALTEFDTWLGEFLKQLKDEDILIITADHGCDPITESTDHSREYVPLLIYGKKVKSVNLGTRKTFADIGKTVADIFGIDGDIKGESFKDKIITE